MAAQPHLLLQCFQDASNAAGPVLERCLDHAIAALQLLEAQNPKIAERDALAASYRYLLANKKSWSERYAAQLLTEFKKSLQPKTVTAAVSRPVTPSGPLAFGLVDDADMSHVIDGQRLLQNLLPGVEPLLGELNALVSSALGLSHVAPERNPMRPEVFTQVLQRLATGTLESKAEAALSFRHLAKPLGLELAHIYANTIKTLKLASVATASYQYRLQPSAPMQQNMPASSVLQLSELPQQFMMQGQGQEQEQEQEQERNDDEPMSPADLSDVQVKTRLLNDFLAEPGQRGEQALAAPYYDNIEQELDALRAAKASAFAALSPGVDAHPAGLSAVNRPQRAVNSFSALSEQVWGSYGTSRTRAMVRTQLKKEAKQVSQALGMEVVRELVNQMAQDPRLLAPVREAIVALEPSLLRLALVDPRFFSDERHPGRMLMERVAQRSFKYNDESGDAFAGFFKDITKTFNLLNAGPVADAKPFAAALAQLEHEWNGHDQQDFDKRKCVLQALRFAEERQSRADQIATELSARSDLQQVPAQVLDFLFGRWALVMAHAHLMDSHNQIDPSGYGSVVSDLVWSVKSDVTLKQPAKLIKLIPGLLDKLHSGLALLGQEPKENEAFFETLMKLHRPVLKLRRLKSQRDAGDSSDPPLESDEPLILPAERLESLRAKADAPLWMGRDELDAAGFEDTQPTAPVDLEAPDSQTVQAEQAAQVLPVLPAQITSTDSFQHRIDGQFAEHSQPATPGPTASQAGLSNDQAAALVRSLTIGSWVDLYSKNQWLRAQLVWASSKALLFMFVSHGGRPHSMTQRSCEKLIAQRLLKPVDTQGVIAQALSGVAGVAAAQSQAVNARPAGETSDHATA